MVIVNKEDLNWRNFTNALLVTEVCDEKKTIPFFFFLQIISVYSMYSFSICKLFSHSIKIAGLINCCSAETGTKYCVTQDK